MTTLTDIEQELKRLYRARETPELVEVPSLSFLMIDGQGDPNTSTSFQDAVQALYAVSYTLKFMLKRAGEPAYRIGPLEGLWWAEEMTSFVLEDKGAYQWTLMIRQPVELTADLLERVVGEVERKKQLPAVRHLRLERFTEGWAAQVLHVGPYAAEAPTIAKLHAFIDAHGFAMRGKHHEIYLGDPRRSAPERLKTIIRQPVREA
jgi:hypothetical protein